MSDAPVNVKAAERRTLSFSSLDDILADAEAMTESSASTGNWNAAENIYHVALLIDFLNRGAPFAVPLPMRLLGKTLKLFRIHVKPIKPGFKAPSEVENAFAPPTDITLEAAKQKLRDETAYAKEHGMNYPSPLFGKLSPDDAVAMNCRHAELHFGFIHPADD